MPHKYTLLLITVGVIVLCDQVTKLYVDAVMWPHQSITVIENYFDITYVRNPGGAFGLFAQANRGIVRPLLLGLSAVAAVIIILIYRSTPPDRILVRLAFSLIMGQRSVSGSPTGSPVVIERMLDFASRHNIAP